MKIKDIVTPVSFLMFPFVLIGSQAVTPRQMTNACNRAVEVAVSASTNYTDMSITSISNYVDSVSPRGLSNYVDKAVGSINSTLLSKSTFDDEIHVEDDGSFYIYNTTVKDGVITNEVKRYSAEWHTEVGELEGARVTSAVGLSCCLTNGQYLALQRRNKFTTNRVFTAGTNVVLNFGKFGAVSTNAFMLGFGYSHITNDPCGAYMSYEFNGSYHHKSDTNGECLVVFSSTQDGHDGRSFTLKQELVLGGITNSSSQIFAVTSRVLQATYTIEPYNLLVGTWNGCLLDMRDQSIVVDDCPLHTNAWVRKEYFYSITVTPQLQPSFVQSAMNPMASTQSGTALASSSASYVLPIATYDYPQNCAEMDAYAYLGLDPDEYWCEPEMIIPREDWDDLENWVKLPQQLTLPVIDASGSVVGYQIRKCNTIKDILKWMDKYGDAHLPPQWPGYTFGERVDTCNTYGHIWHDCECMICHERRDHYYEFLYAGYCKRCSNRNVNAIPDTRSKSKWKPGDEGDYCNHVCENPVAEDHTGWHHIGDRFGEVACCCQCELFDAARAQPHDVDTESSISTWTDSGDGSTHFGTLNCRRSPCTAVVKKYVKHTLQKDTGSSETPEYKDEHDHRAMGKCSANGCEFTGWMTEPHTRDADCNCTVCSGTSLHSWTGTSRKCGKNSAITCIYCGRVKKDDSGAIGSVFEHDFSSPSYESLEKHTCACGETYHYHVWENNKCVGGSLEEQGSKEAGDNGCKNEKSWSGHKCPFKKKSSGKESTDQDHDNDSSGTGLDGECGKCNGKMRGGDVTDVPEGVVPKQPPYPYPDPDNPTQPDPSHPENYKTGMRWAYTLTGSHPSREQGADKNFDHGLTVIATMLGVAKNYLQVGDSWSVTIWHTPVENSLKTRAGDLTQTTWKTGTYSCTKAVDKNGNTYYDWK